MGIFWNPPGLDPLLCFQVLSYHVEQAGLCVCSQSGGRLIKWDDHEPGSGVTRGMGTRADPGSNFSLQVSMFSIKALLCSISLESSHQRRTSYKHCR